jgi:hypothetical protein
MNDVRHLVLYTERHEVERTPSIVVRHESPFRKVFWLFGGRILNCANETNHSIPMFVPSEKICGVPGPAREIRVPIMRCRLSR